MHIDGNIELNNTKVNFGEITIFKIFRKNM